MGTIEENAKSRIEKEKLKKDARRDQYVVLTIDDNGNVINMENDWNNNNSQVFDPQNPCEFTTPVDIGKTITWMGLSEKDNNPINIEYVLMNNAKGKQILKSKSYNRGQNDAVTGKVKPRSIRKHDVEYYMIIYSVNDKIYILDPKMEVHGEL